MFAERGVEHDVRRLATDARQRFERLAIPWYFAAVQVQYLSTQADDVLRLGLIQADGLDVLAQPRFAERKARLRRVGDREQFRGRLVDAYLGSLRRPAERKSVVSGKSESVGVYIGG